MVVTIDLPLILAGIGIMLAVPLTFMVANWVRKNVDHGEARFGPDGKMISDKETNDE
ncbi:glutamyl-tRNA amidotransferase [Erythrobacter sp. KY5]|nr:glutamyl-tRNA amidotransferase [Erythrobacter sp. KY5]